MKIKIIDNFVTKLKTTNYKALFIRALVIVVIMGLFFIPIYFIFNAVDANLWEALKSGDADSMLASIKEYDSVYGVLIITILQVVQDIVIIIPSAPVHLVAGMVLGTWNGFWVCHISDVAANMFIFFVYSKIKKYVDKFMPIDESNSTVRMIKQGKSSTYMIVMVCLLPAVPNGFIPYAAVNAGLALGKYTLAVTLGCAVPTIVMTAIGEQIMDMNWLMMTFLIALSFVGVFILLRYQHHILKMLELAKHKSTMLLTTEIPQSEIDASKLDRGDGVTPRRYKISRRVMYPAKLKYQDIPTSDVSNPFAAFFSFKQTPVADKADEEERKNDTAELMEQETDGVTVSVEAAASDIISDQNLDTSGEEDDDKISVD